MAKPPEALPAVRRLSLQDPSSNNAVSRLNLAACRLHSKVQCVKDNLDDHRPHSEDDEAGN